MTIADLYQNYKVPPNLQDHMKRVASIGAFIAEQWKDDGLKKDKLIQALLLHDTGNIIKFDFSVPQMFEEVEKQREYWKQVQKEFTEKYKDEHTAIIMIAKEIGLNNESLDILLAVGSNKLADALATSDWNKKIACYSDFRVDPLGVVTVNKRFDDINARYKGRDHENGNVELVEKKRLLCLELEAQIQQHMSRDLETITNEDIAAYRESFGSYELHLETV